MFLLQDDRKISIIGGFLLLGLTLTTGLAVYSVMRQQIESTLGRGLHVALQGKAHLLESQIEKGLADTHAVITRPFLIQTMQHLSDNPGENSELLDLQKNVDSLPLSGFSAALVSDKQGLPLSQVGEFSKTHLESLPLNKQGNTFLVWDNQFILRTTEDILNHEGSLLGRITTEKPLPKLTRSFGAIRTIGETGEFILCAPLNSDTQERACLISQMEGVKFNYWSHKIGDESLPMDYAIIGRSGVITIKDYRQIAVIAAFAPLPSVELSMVLKLDEEELFSPITQQLKTVILYLAGLIIAEILLLNWFVRKLVKSEKNALNAKEKAEQFFFELSQKKIELQERLKEISCLYEIRRGIGVESSIDNVCQNIFEHLIPAMQFPEIATAVIALDGWQFNSGKFQSGTLHYADYSKIKLTETDNYACCSIQDSSSTCKSEVYVNNILRGYLCVFYTDHNCILLPEEIKLVHAIANDLESWLERKSLEHALVSIAEEQQHTIGQELHDNLGQQIAAIGFQAMALEKQISASGKIETSAVAASIAQQAQIAVIQIRQLAQGLLPFELEASGLIPAMEALAKKIANTYNINCNFYHNDDIDINDNNQALNLYRIAQEAANNAIRHGNAKQINISLTAVNRLLCLSICDDGCGFTEPDINHPLTPGMGIKIMQYRAKQMGAKLELLPCRIGGIEVRLEMQTALI